MFKNKPITLIIAAGLLILLIAAAGVYPLISGNMRFGGPGGMANGNQQRGGNFPSDGNLPNGFTPPQGGFDNGQTNRNPGGNDQFSQGAPNGNFTGANSNFSSVAVKLFQLLRILQQVGAVVVMIFAVLAIIGIFLGKDWGRKLAITAAILAIIFTAAGMFGFRLGLSLWIRLAALLISIAILVLSLLSKSRRMATVPA